MSSYWTFLLKGVWWLIYTDNFQTGLHLLKNYAQLKQVLQHSVSSRLSALFDRIHYYIIIGHSIPLGGRPIIIWDGGRGAKRKKKKTFGESPKKRFRNCETRAKSQSFGSHRGSLFCTGIEFNAQDFSSFPQGLSSFPQELSWTQTQILCIELDSCEKSEPPWLPCSRVMVGLQI